MVLLAAAICTKQGKALVSRQFVEMSRSRIEGLLSAFPKLMNTGRQHTFVETESVRYVYQPLESLYMLLITTTTSNILEDLETLRLFSRVIPEYCQSLDEHDVSENAFDLIFAFDEIVALGYRESVNLAQIRTFTEMDSHEERVFEAMRKTQEREAKEEMKRRAKELQQAKREAKKMGGIGGGGRYGGGFGSQGYGGGGGGGGGYSSVTADTSSYEPTTKPSHSSRPTGGMKLGKKTKDADSFVDKLVAEGEKVVSATTRPSGSATKAPPTGVQQSVVHLKVNEHLTVVAGRDGGLQTMEILGMITLRIADGDYGRVTIAIDHKKEQRGIQFQTHPNVDKRLFQDSSLISLKGEGKSFPIGQDIGVLKWRLQTTDDSLLPLFINCWPSENAGSCDVNVEYELLQNYLELNQVVISIPIQSGTPVIGEIDGEHHYDTRKRVLEWCVPIIDTNNKTGSLEFTVPGAHPDDFFPIKVTFGSSHLYCHVQVMGIKQVEDGRPVEFSSEVSFSPDKFEIV